MATSNPKPVFDRHLLPGSGLPINFDPHPARIRRGQFIQSTSSFEQIAEEAQGEGGDLFPSALHGAVSQTATLFLTTLREFRMLQLMNDMTDKAGWETKVFDDEIVAKWKEETLTNAEVFSEKMFEYCIAELRHRSKETWRNGAVFVYAGDVIKSDVQASLSLVRELQVAVRPLEEVPPVYQDWHPGSDGKVLDLVHPSLYPVIYGRTRIRKDVLLGLEKLGETICTGEELPVPPEVDAKLPKKETWEIESEPYSRKFQWLPCDVDLHRDRGDDSGSGECSCSITSYINNLHPDHFRGLYGIIERVISLSIPLWNMTLSGTLPGGLGSANQARIAYKGDWDEDAEIVQPEPGEFKPRPDEQKSQAGLKVNLVRDFAHRGLQVIVKLASIHLTPEKPRYDGGSWHVEGHLNEHIAATSLFYYSCENITASHLSFRQQCDTDTTEMEYAQDDHRFLSEIFGCEQDGPGIQDVGSVVCKEGRMVTFPNILQHRVAPFELADKSKPGHRKILCLFLVDPHIRIISSANVPPQQRELWADEICRRAPETRLGRLAVELQRKIVERVDAFPIGMHEAKEIRLELMEERSEFRQKLGALLESYTFSLCEH